MARTYAGILGLLAFATVVARSLIHDTAGGQAIWQASLTLFGFAGIGYVLGLMAQWILDDSIRGRLTIEITRNMSGKPDKDLVKQTATTQ
jgi:hypothetical protein